MMVTVATVIDEMRPRAQRLGLADPATGLVDDSELTTYLLESLRYLANRYQLQHFLEINRQLFTTIANVEAYALPENYGFWAPEETRRSGIAVTNTDGTQTTNLEYYDPARFNVLRNPGLTNRPAWFTVTQSLLYLSPVPDKAYVIEGIERQVQDGSDIPMPYVEAIKIEALFKMASDVAHVAPKSLSLLAEERKQILRTLVNNEARFRQRFYTSRERVGMSRYGRYSR
jgi:hypothetical protein